MSDCRFINGHCFTHPTLVDGDKVLAGEPPSLCALGKIELEARLGAQATSIATYQQVNRDLETRLAARKEQCSHPHGGMTIVVECVECHQPYPTWKSDSGMMCPGCHQRLTHAQDQRELERLRGVEKAALAWWRADTDGGPELDALRAALAREKQP